MRSRSFLSLLWPLIAMAMPRFVVSDASGGDSATDADTPAPSASGYDAPADSPKPSLADRVAALVPKQQLTARAEAAEARAAAAESAASQLAERVAALETSQEELSAHVETLVGALENQAATAADLEAREANLAAAVREQASARTTQNLAAMGVDQSTLPQAAASDGAADEAGIFSRMKASKDPDEKYKLAQQLRELRAGE